MAKDRALTLEALRVMDAIDRRGSFAAAADELGRVPSALSYTMQKLEEELDVILFDRSGHRTKFTNVGRMLLERGRVLLEAADKLTTDADALARGWETHLTLVTEALVPTQDIFPLVEKLATKSNTLHTMGPAPEPNLTILWSEALPIAFKKYAAQVSIVTSSLQYENDDLMRTDFASDDYAIACCVSPMVIGKQMQFFGARANLAKTLLYAINGGVDEKLKIQVGPKTAPLLDEVLDYDTVMQSLDHFMDWLAVQYISALNIIHFMHDKYSYEASLMALHDRDVYRTMACGIAGLSVAADSLSAIKYATVKPVRDHTGLAVDFVIEGEYPQYGNNDERVDSIACDLVERFMKKIKVLPTYRNAVPTQSILTITSNVVYGQKTGNTPDGRRAGTPFAPGANPMHGRDRKGAVASLTSVAKLPFTYAKDGISYTFSIVPAALGKDDVVRKTNLVGLLDGYFHHEANVEGGQHLNVNVMNRDMLLAAIEHPEAYPNLTIRVSGYAVRFNALTREQQQDVISRTFTQAI
jgi:formate C-acetyltransferase